MNKKLKGINLNDINEAKQKVMEWFFSYPTKEITLTHLSNQLKIAKKTASHIVKKLKDEGFLNIKIIGKSWLISCSHTHYYNSTKKVAYNLMMIHNSNILEETRKSVPQYRSIILFGSYRKGDDNENSDIDIAVEVIRNQDLKIIELGVISEFGFRKNVKVNLHIFSRNKIDINLFSNIANGIVLEGFLEVRP